MVQEQTPFEVPAFAATLIGTYQQSVDKKGRVALPVPFRELFESTLFVTRGLEPCLVAFLPRAFDILCVKIQALPLSHSQARLFSRLICSGRACDVDQRGRIHLTPDPRHYA